MPDWSIYDQDYTGFSTVDYATNGSPDPLEKAAAYAEDVRQDVLNQFEYIRRDILGAPSSIVWNGEEWVNTGGGGNVINDTMDTVTALMNFDFQIPDDELVPQYPDWAVNVDFNLPEVKAKDFGTISDWALGGAPSPGTFPTISPVTVPNFVPSIASLNIPDAPLPSVFEDPGNAPDAPLLDFPNAPVITLPDKPNLQQLNLPSSPTITLPDVPTLVFPEIENMDINTYIQWSEPTYEPEIWADVKAQIQRFFEGGSGIRPEVEEAMVARGRDREDRLVRQQEMQATEEWAGRGFTAPPGMLVKRIDNIREEGLLKKLSINRDVLIKAMDEELANIRLGVQQGIVAEQLFVQIHLAAVERLFLIQRFHVEWEIQKYNLLVDLYRARAQENLIRAQVFEIQVRAALAELEVFKALVEAELAKAEINKALVQAYTAEIEARESLVNLYKTQIEAVKVHADIFETEVRAYGEKVAAFGQRVNADKLRYDAYASQIQGEVAKTNIIEAEARAYTAKISGLETGVRAQTAVLEGAIAAFRAEVDAYEAQLRGLIGKNQVELSSIQANVAGYQADTQRYIASVAAEEAKAKTELAAWETQSRYDLAWFEAKNKEFEVTINRILGQKALIVEALKSAGSLSSTIAAGGLAALHASASISGSGGITGSGTDNRSNSNQTSTNFGCNTNNNRNADYRSPTDPQTNCIF